MKPAIRSQRGIAITALLFYVVLVIVVVTLVMKLGPVYMEYFEIRKVMQNLTDDPDLTGKGAYQISRSIENRLDINYFDSVKKDDFKIRKVKDGYRVSLKYDVREHILANVDALLTFSHQVVIKE